MAEARVIPSRVKGLLEAYGWTCRVDRGRLEAREPAFTPIDHVFIGGNANAIRDSELADVRIERVIVQDNPPEDDLHRLQSVVASLDHGPAITTFSRFIDEVWNAPDAARQARRDAEQREELNLIAGLTPTGASPQASHVTQRLQLDAEGGAVPDYALIDSIMPAHGGIVSVIADAGIGKTELLKLHEWRTGAAYEAATVRYDFKELPHIALRVRLRNVTSLSLSSIARLLAEPQGEGGVFGLTRITSGAVLRALLITGRIVLMLDGADELSVTREQLIDEIGTLRQVALEGGRIVISTRTGHFRSVNVMTERLADQPTATILPMNRAEAVQLLKLYGASDADVRSTLEFLSSEVIGIPLFLLLGYACKLESPIASEAGGPRATILLDLIRRFCARDHQRVGLSADVQVAMLTDLAEWLAFVGPIDLDQAFPLLGLVQGEPGAGMLENPHALLEHTVSTRLHFRYADFFHLFLARAIINQWGGDEPSSTLLSAIGAVVLESTTLQYMAQLLSDSQLRSAWSRASADTELRQAPFLRRNLLGTALAKLDVRAQGESPAGRADLLAEMLNGRDLSEVALVGLALEHLDFKGWNLSRIRGRGGHIKYSRLRGAHTDSSILTVEDLEGSSGIDAPLSPERYAYIEDRLRKALQPWINRRVKPSALKPKLAISTRDLDYETMRRLQARKLLKLKRGPRGSQFWEWTELGKDSVSDFIQGGKATGSLELVVKDLARR